jgi:hypothetical protein
MSNNKYTSDDIHIVKQNKNITKTVDISLNSFKDNLGSSAQHALDFARSLVFNVLPDSIQYNVYLGASYDENPLEEGEETYPDDYVDGVKRNLNSDEVVELLWRDGKVPEWVNVSVEIYDHDCTSIKLECCGRFSDNKKHIYHAHEGRAPFHVLGPSMPIGHEPSENNKYDLNWNKSE